MSEQRSDKHAPWLDDELKDVTQGEVRGGYPGHTEEWRGNQHAGEDAPRISRAPSAPLPGGVPAGMSASDVELRSHIAQYIPMTVYPARRGDLLSALRRGNAPDALYERLRRLPADRRFHNVREVVQSLGIAVEHGRH
jgi:hypothetical protein